MCVPAGDVYVAADSGRDTSGVSGLVLRSMDTLQGYKVLGHNKQEKALAVGTCLTAIGEVVNTNPAVYFSPFASSSYICILLIHLHTLHTEVFVNTLTLAKCKRWFIP